MNCCYCFRPNAEVAVPHGMACADVRQCLARRARACQFCTHCDDTIEVDGAYQCANFSDCLYRAARGPRSCPQGPRFLDGNVIDWWFTTPTDTYYLSGNRVGAFVHWTIRDVSLSVKERKAITL